MTFFDFINILEGAGVSHSELHLQDGVTLVGFTYGRKHSEMIVLGELTEDIDDEGPKVVKELGLINDFGDLEY